MAQDKERLRLLQMADVVARKEPDLRDTLHAARITAVASIQGCFLALHIDDDIDVSMQDTREHRDWTAAQAIFRDTQSRVEAIVAALVTNSAQMQANRQAQEQKASERMHAEIDFLSSAPVDESVRGDVAAYIDYLTKLMAWGEERNAGRHPESPASPSRETFDAVWIVLATDKSGQREATQRELHELQVAQGSLGQEFHRLRVQLNAEVAQQEGVATATDQANLTAAKALYERFRPYARKKPRLKELAHSAVRTCTAVIMLAERVQVVKNSPNGLADATW